MDIAGIQAAVRREVNRARRALRDGDDPDEAVHAARKSLKRARAGLRLLEPAVGRGACELEKERLRRIAGQLAGLRDARVQLVTLAALLREEKDPRRREVLRALQAHWRRTQRSNWRAMRAADAFPQIDEALASSAKRVVGWPAPAGGAALGEAARRLFRRSRKALERSIERPSDESLHEARKRLKELGHALDLLAAGAGSARLRKTLARLEEAGDLLGKDHDLAVLEAEMESVGAPGGPRRKLRQRVERRRRKLQRKALKRARPVFGKKTRALVAGLSG